MKQILITIGLLILPLLGMMKPVSAQTGGAQQAGLPDGIASAQFLPGWQQTAWGHMAALELVLTPEWKTYWRAPGSGGIPPVFDWTGSQNLGEVRFYWPRPQVFEVGGITSIGYHGHLVLPIAVTGLDPDLPVVLQAKINLGICKDICVPAELNLRIALPQTASAPDPKIISALSDMPVKNPDLAHCSVEPIADGMRLTAQMYMPQIGANEVAVFEHPNPKMWLSDTTTLRQGPQLTAVADIVPPNAQPFDLNPKDILITIFGEGRAVEIQGCASATAP